MNVTKAAQFVTKAMTKMNSMPKWAKVGSAILGAGAIFGGGMLAEKSIIGDRFEKIDSRLTAVEGYLFTKALEEAKKSDTTAVAQAEELKPAEKKAVEEENTFKYVPPEVDGERIVKTVETKFAGSDVVEKRQYLGGDGKVLWEERFNSDGSLKEYLDFGKGDTIKIEGNTKYVNDKYNSKGEKISYLHKLSDGGAVYRELQDNGEWDIYEYDKKGRPTYIKTNYDIAGYKSIDATFFTYNSDGSYKARTCYWHQNNSEPDYIDIDYYNSKDKLLKTKRLDYINKILQYTVIPKYDKDGVLIKNDTVWNK